MMMVEGFYCSAAPCLLVIRLCWGPLQRQDAREPPGFLLRGSFFSLCPWRMTHSARVVPAVLRPPRGVLFCAAVRLFLYGQARVRGRAQGADAALLRAQRARQRGGQRALVAMMSEVATAERQLDLHHAQPRGVDGEAEAVLLRERAPFPLLLLVHQACEDVDPPLLSPLGAEVAQHYPTEEYSVERHDD